MKRKKMIACILSLCMLATMMPVTVMAENGPDMTGTTVDVTADNAQDVLDGKYGDINGKTIHFTEDIEVVLDLARPTKYQGSGTIYYNYVNSALETEPTEWSDSISSVMNSHSHYYRTLEDVTFTADDGVTVAGFTFSAGHVASSGYDYVRGVEQTTGVTYYKHSSLEDITFDGLTITGQFDAKLYMEGSTVKGITFDGCTFTGTTDDGDNAAIKFLADNQYFTDITVENCSIDGYFQGVYIQGVDGADIVDNSISNTEHNAIALQSCDVAAKGDIAVKENYITDVSDRAIRFNAVDASAEIVINNNIMVDCGDDEGQLIKAGDVAGGASVDLESNYWDGEDVSTAVSGLAAPTVVGITGGDWEDKDVSVSNYVAPGFRVENGEVVEATAIATVNGVEYADLQEAIKAAAPDGTVEILSDVTVDKWIMFAESLSIGNGNLITLKIDGLTINGNGHTLTVNSIESAGNGNRLFYDATNLNINDLTIKYADGVAGGIGLKSGTINNVTFEGGTYGVLPGAGDVTIKDSTFKTNSTAIYYEEERDNLTVTGNTFELDDDTNVILLRGDTEFTNNTIVSGRTVNVVSGSPVVTGNDFNDVRFKVYNGAEATIKNNTINNLVFDSEDYAENPVKSTFANNALSDAAQEALDAAGVENVKPVDPTPSTSSKKSTKKYAVSIDDDEIENGSIKLSSSKAKKGATVTLTVTPDAGYKLDKLVVLDDDGDKVELTDKGNGKFTFKMPRGGVEVDASFVEIEGVEVDDEIVIVLTIDETLMLIDGEYVVNDVAPIIRGERTVLPIRVIAEALGASVSWNEAEQTVTIVKGEMTIVIYIGQAFALVNGEPVALDQPAFIENGRTYLPLRFIMENLGAEVAWNGAAQTVTIIG